MREPMGYRSDRAEDENPGAPASLPVVRDDPDLAGRDAGAPREKLERKTLLTEAWTGLPQRSVERRRAQKAKSPWKENVR